MTYSIIFNMKLSEERFLATGNILNLQAVKLIAALEKIEYILMQ